MSAPTLVALSGYATAGKDAAAAALIADGWRRLSFADVLRSFLYAQNPVVLTGRLWWKRYEHLTDVIDRIGWDEAKRRYPSVRALQQRTGTDAGRAILGDSVWVDAAFGTMTPTDRVVVTDVRFPSELEAVRSRGGVVVRIDRPGVGPVNAHESETALDSAAFDAYVLNDGSLLDLHAAIRGVVSGRR